MTWIWQAMTIVEAVGLILLTIVMAGVLRYLHSIQDLAAPPISRYKIGETMEPFTLPTVRGDTFSLSSYVSDGHASIILVTTANCPACKTLLRQVERGLGPSSDSRGTHKKLVIVAVGNLDDSDMVRLAELQRHGVVVVVDGDGETFRKYGLRVTPTGFVVDEHGRVMDQTWNPHAGNWLYRHLGLATPEAADTAEPVAVVVPTAMARRRIQE